MPTIEKLDEERALAELPELVCLLQDAINNGASLGFFPPLTVPTAEKYWRETLREVREGSRLLLVARENGAITGSVQAQLEKKETGSHRAEVQKLIVNTHFRKRGFGSALLKALEDEAQRLGRTLLVLDTESGSEAENLYPKCGYVRAGEIPKFALKIDQTLVGTVVFYKMLA